jgi:hypothetical protein
MGESKDINFDAVKEDWNIYKLEDGTVLKIKIVLVRIIQEGIDQIGNPMAGTLMNNVIVAIPPENLRNLKEIAPKFDLKFEIIKESWNEYSVEDGFILKIKPTLSQIDRLDKVDPRGDPLYRVLAQPNAKRIPKSKDK